MLWSNFQSVVNSVKSALANWQAIVSMEYLWDAIFCKEFLQDLDGLGGIALRCRDSSNNGHFGVVICDN